MRLDLQPTRIAAGAVPLIIAAFFAVAPRVSGATAEEKAAACLACHGANGTSGIPETPSLGGQPEFYLTVLMLMFRDKLRVSEPKNQAMQGFTDDDLRNLAAYLTRLSAPDTAAAGAVDTDRTERARAVIEQHRCNFCHQRNYGGEHNVPRLAGQREDYLVKAMREYKSNTRRGYDASMADVLYPISDEQIRDLAYFFARVK